MNPEVRTARKKPVKIEYMVWPGGAAAATPVIDWILGNDGTARYHSAETEQSYDAPNATVVRDPEHIDIDTLEGTMRADVGDVIIRGIKGEFYPCKPDVFKLTYDVVEHIGMEPSHRVSFGYTVDDDGIHLICTCGHHSVIGHNPDVAAIAIAVTNHIENPEGN